MLESSFIFLRGVQRTTERLIRRQVRTWNGFLRTKSIRGIGWKMKRKHDMMIRRAQFAQSHADVAWFAKYWPANETWRLFDWCKEDALYLDIETESRGHITLIGMYFQGTYYHQLFGKNLGSDLFKQMLNQASLLVTFNGASFDWPVLKKYFGLDELSIPHLDLRGACGRVNLKGGLKHIEATLGIDRSDDVIGFNGMDAMMAFEQYRRGDEEALDHLITYNKYDTVNLKHLAELVVPRLTVQMHQ